MTTKEIKKHIYTIIACIIIMIIGLFLVCNIGMSDGDGRYTHTNAKQTDNYYNHCTEMERARLLLNK